MKRTWAQQAVVDLESWGWTLTGIAEATGISLGSVSDLKQLRTKEPTGMGAVKLSKLHDAKQGPEPKAA